ncbi:uncharacterized protein LOC119069097 [Bradysia coprophila]|uniref:uncharacterized protein LOC119069097 n=1 Tax=Bradysia coprophila TaxID=38358 RepID=UPI00187DC1CF|nr:uncharacterized protein LOC119069097 [Bradysia coprophila]
MELNVVGEWKYFNIRLVELTDIPKILEFYAEHGHDPLRDLAPVDETYDDYSAVRIAALMESEEKEDAFRAASKTEETIPPFRKIMNSLHATLHDSKLGMFGRYGVESVVWNFLVVVDSKQRGKGLASEMYARVVRLLRSKKMSLAFSIYTSPFSRRAAQKVGFVEIDRAYFNELRDENGAIILPNATQDDFASVMVLQM